jgi:hypothetical protein
VASVGFDPMIPSQDQAFFEHRRGHRLVNPQLAAAKLVGIAARDPAETELVAGPGFAKRKLVRMKVWFEQQRAVVG